MKRMSLKRRVLSGLVLSAGLWFSLQGVGVAQDRNQADTEKSSIGWHSAAKLRHIAGGNRGDLSIGAEGIEFRSEKGQITRLSYLEVQSFFLSPHSLTIETYQNRKRHMPGVERYRFDVTAAVPPEVAVELAKVVQRPSQNSVTDPAAQGATIPAHHRTVRGGTNGTLRFRDGGIDYVTTTPGDSRSWRWTDLQTLSAPDPYHLLVFGYRDTYTFDLKEALAQSSYYRLVDTLDRHNTAEPLQKIDTHALSTPTDSGAGVQK